MINIPKSVQKSCCNAENKNRHCEPQAWQSRKTNTIFEKESETPLTAVGTLTALLRNSTKVLDYLSQKVTYFIKLQQSFSSLAIVTISTLVLALSISEARAVNRCSAEYTTQFVTNSDGTITRICISSSDKWVQTYDSAGKIPPFY